MEPLPKTIFIYQTSDGTSPFDEWYQSLKDTKTKLIIRKRLNRLILGNPGDCRSLRDSLFELRIDYGPGYRIYFYQEDDHIVVLLSGGDKSSQKSDIKKAKEYLDDYKAR